MKIGIDARFLTHPQKGGFKTYTENLILALAEVDTVNEYVLYLDRNPDRDTLLPDKQNFTYQVVSNPLPFFGMVWREQSQIPRQANKDQLDLFHSPCLSAPLRIGCPYIVTIHDMIWASPYKFGSNGSGPASARRKFQEWYYQFIPRLAARRALAIITVSEFSKASIMEHLSISADRIFVTHEAASPAYRPLSDRTQIEETFGKYAFTGKYILAIGSADPRKNILTLLQAYALLPGRLRDEFQLVIVWNHGYLTNSMEDKILQLGLKGRVRFLEWVTNEDLLALYNAAAVFVFPSLYEGFGLPLIEAMACGTPVVAADNSSIPEIVAQAALLTLAQDPDGMAEKISLVLSDENIRTRLITRGFERAASFSWKLCASQTVKIYEEAVLTEYVAKSIISI